MTDTMTPNQRHYCMSRIRSRNTKPELLVRQWLWNHGYRYRLNVKSVPGKPDIVMRKYRTAIFVNGCFWHGHGVALGVKPEDSFLGSSSVASGFNPEETGNESCCRIPQTNREFWMKKIQRNQERDQKNYHLLRNRGWQVIVVWECELKPKQIEETMTKVELQLNENFLNLHKHQKGSFAYHQESDVPMAAEEQGSYS